MNFMDNLKTTLDETSYSVTENGALGFSTSGSKLLDLNFGVTSFRNKSEKDIENAFAKAFYEDKKTALKWLFYARDVRGGIGERRLFRTCLKWLAENHSSIAMAVFHLAPYYGRYDDMWCLLDTGIADMVIEVVKEQLVEDWKNMTENKACSLIAKWLPSINSTSKETKRLAQIIVDGLETTPKGYRLTLSGLRKYLKVIEVKMSAGEWNEIDYNAVPSRANLLYKNAFLKHDEDRRRAYLDALERGDKDVKINSGVLFPDDIVRKYGNGRTGHVGAYDSALEELWKALPTLSSDNTLVVRDGSGSMTWDGGKPMDVATALAIYMAERNHGEFHNQFITFSRVPKIINLNGLDTLHDKLAKTYGETDCSNTDIEAVFRLILNTAIKHNMTQEDMPKNIVIVSDMQFDAHSHNCKDTLFEAIGKGYESHGFKLPRLIFWNVNNRSNGTIPVQQNAMGVVLVSGYSQNLIKMVMSNQTDPYKCLIEQLNTERYQLVEEAVKDIL